MEKQVEELTLKLSNIAKETTETYKQGTLSEQKQAYNGIQKLKDEIDSIFKHYMGIVPHNVINNLTEQTNELLKQTIANSRVRERNATVQRLADTRAESMSEMSHGIKEFKSKGVSKDENFEEKVDEVLNRVVKAYRTVLDQKPSKSSDMALGEISNYSRSTFNKLKNLHEDYTKIIESEVIKKIDTLELPSEAKEQFVEKAKSTIPGLENMVQEDAVIGENDVRELSQNELAFKGSETRKHNTRKDLEAMFK